MRKPRTIKNGIVDIDDVKIEPGVKYENWIPITREKLGEREATLLNKRVELCMHSIATAITDFYHVNESYFHRNINIEQVKNLNLHIFTDSFINNGDAALIAQQCKAKISEHLDCWKGIQRSKKITASFRDYFKISKNWWDQRKIDITAQHFWIPIINLIIQVNNTTISQVYSDHSAASRECYMQYLSASILDQLFHAMLKMANSRERLLIPAGVFLSFCNEQDGAPFFHELAEHDENALSGKGGKCARDIILSFLREKKEKFKVEIHQFLENDECLPKPVPIPMSLPPVVPTKPLPFSDMESAQQPDEMNLNLNEVQTTIKLESEPEMQSESQIDGEFMATAANSNMYSFAVASNVSPTGMRVEGVQSNDDHDQLDDLFNSYPMYNESMQGIDEFDAADHGRNAAESASPPPDRTWTMFESSSASPSNYEPLAESQCTAVLDTEQQQHAMVSNHHLETNNNYGHVHVTETNNSNNNHNNPLLMMRHNGTEYGQNVENLNHLLSRSQHEQHHNHHHHRHHQLDLQSYDKAQLPNLQIYEGGAYSDNDYRDYPHAQRANFRNNGYYQMQINQLNMELPPVMLNNSNNDNNVCYTGFANAFTESAPSRSRQLNEAQPPLYNAFYDTSNVVEPPQFDLVSPPNHYNLVCNHCGNCNHSNYHNTHANVPQFHCNQNYQNYHNSGYHVSSMRYSPF
eukprot:CAMPEP_0197036298 /NCGR_PEP_ID=MMETSP1384-20130603/13849_1 /TAXON_ID=29189 /ORGANISM="Ammonia sp." /LENGTH=690 /DNA_ID=CAMNT_0042466465 /DNA_START=262 /DNA_END=2334 /DNA_ORIENTATION=+